MKVHLINFIAFRISFYSYLSAFIVFSSLMAVGLTSFTNLEMADMHYIYGAVAGNVLESGATVRGSVPIETTA